MLYTTFTVNEKEYKLRINTKACIDLEKKLGTNPVNILQNIASTGEVPEIGLLMQILHASMVNYNHGITLEQVYAVYDDYVDEGHTLSDLIPVIVDVFEVSGFFKKGDAEKN